ncbi:hypothetical protein [Bradyrhizobium sp. URHC0002]
MRIGMNLRGDLAKLDDAEIASRYEALIREKEVRILEAPKYARHRLLDRLWTILFGRGLFHARIFYKINALIFGGLAALKGHELLMPSDYNAYLSECELKDVTDEMKRRIALRKAQTAS